MAAQHAPFCVCSSDPWHHASTSRSKSQHTLHYDIDTAQCCEAFAAPDSVRFNIDTAQCLETFACGPRQCEALGRCCSDAWVVPHSASVKSSRSRPAGTTPFQDNKVCSSYSCIWAMLCSFVLGVCCPAACSEASNQLPQVPCTPRHSARAQSCCAGRADQESWWAKPAAL